MKKILVILLSFVACGINAQEHNTSKNYVWPKDELVGKKLNEWRQLKFGLLMHWGTYSQWGIVESWSICPEDEGWTQRRGPYSAVYADYVKAYEQLQATFNPVQFNPSKWSVAAKDAGMKYMVFTTKHHDGFCMFDTRQTDYKITDPKTPFSSNPKSNIAKEVFSAFRQDGFMIGAYFSKPDWHSNDYWWRYFPPKDRNPSYNPAKYPDKWKQFKQFTYNQIEELMTGYGSVDILWLDGGWVRPKQSIDTAIDWQRAIPYDQDIDIASIAKMGRTHQPGLLVVDRTVSGEYENYVTPEQSIPPHYLPYPWESCITLGNSWSYVPNDRFKSAGNVIQLLTDVVSRNGNLLLNVAPGPGGDWDSGAYSRLQEIGQWLKINGEAIYGTRGDSLVGEQGRFVFTLKDQTVYAIYRATEKESLIPTELSISHLPAGIVKNVNMLGTTQRLNWKQEKGTLKITVPDKLLAKLPCSNAWVIKIGF